MRTWLSGGHKIPRAGGVGPVAGGGGREALCGFPRKEVLGQQAQDCHTSAISGLLQGCPWGCGLSPWGENGPG